MRKTILSAAFVGGILLSGFANASVSGEIDGAEWGAWETLYNYEDGDYGSYQGYDYALNLSDAAPGYNVTINYQSQSLGYPDNQVIDGFEIEQLITVYPPGYPDGVQVIGGFYQIYDASGFSGSFTQFLTPGTYLVLVDTHMPTFGKLMLNNSIAAVPEPETWALLGMGAIALIARNSSRKKLS
ncbi:hypothetical protein JCM19000A_35510 [Silvimonas sp. JCM 19000]